MKTERVYALIFASEYPHYVKKAETKLLWKHWLKTDALVTAVHDYKADILIEDETGASIG